MIFSHPTPEEQANLRYRLLQSARRAKMSGISREEWAASDVIKKFIEANSLREDLPEHIGAWVWTFRR